VVVITISGPHGSGKSTYAQAIAKALKLKYVSSGQTFRRLAKEYECNLEEFSRKCENDKDIDRKIDQITIDEAKSGNVILEGQLAAWMTMEFADLHIYVTASLKTRVTRIAERDGTNYKDARKETIARTRSEVRRFKRMYNVNIENTDIYDIILSTDRLPRELCVAILIASCKEFINNRS